MDDLISRQEILRAFEEMCSCTDYGWDERDFRDLIKKMPSAEPERKKGKWIGKEQYANSPEYYSWQCSVCGIVLEDPTLDKPYPFCPICGSYNGGEESE